MIRYIVICLFVLAGLLGYDQAALAAPELDSTAAVLMDADSGQILYEKNMAQSLPPASITKILTMLLAIENSTAQQQITVSEQAVMSLPPGTSHIGLQAEEIVTMEDLLYAAAMMSANDACNVMAEAIAGSNEAFARMMNQRAVTIGCTNSNFVNPHGLSDDNHYSSARDMALITREALNNSEFQKYFGAVTGEMAPTNKVDEPRFFATQHDMLKMGKYYYEDVDGGKTGYTSAAQNTLVTSAQRDGRRLITVVLQSASAQQRYGDTAKLLDYGFEEFRSCTTLRAELFEGERELPYTEKGNVLLELKADQDFHYLLHQSLESSDIVQQLLLPAVWEDDAQALLRVSLSSPNAAMYQELGIIPLTAEVLSRANADSSIRMILSTMFKLTLRVLCVILVMLILSVIILRSRKVWMDYQHRSLG